MQSIFINNKIWFPADACIELLNREDSQGWTSVKTKQITPEYTSIEFYTFDKSTYFGIWEDLGVNADIIQSSPNQCIFNSSDTESWNKGTHGNGHGLGWEQFAHMKMQYLGNTLSITRGENTQDFVYNVTDSRLHFIFYIQAN